jgi:hypothetical protein
MTGTDENTRKDSLLAEYKSAHDSFHNFDAFRWRSGSMVIGVSVVLWGFFFSGQTPPVNEKVAVVSVFTSILLSCWLFYANHYRQLYMIKLYRIHQIEHEMGMTLNARLGFRGLPNTGFKVYGLKGHYVDMVVYVLVSLFGPFYNFINNWVSGVKGTWYDVLIPFLSVPIVVLSIAWISKNESKMNQWYESNPPWEEFGGRS